MAKQQTNSSQSKAQIGSISAAAIAAGAERSVAVTFPVAFATVPIVLASTNHKSGVGTNDYVSLILSTASTITTTGFTLYMKNFGAGTSGTGVFAVWRAEI